MKKSYILIAIYLGLILLFFALGLHHLFTFQMLKEYRMELSAFVMEHAVMAALLYMLVYATLIALSVPGGAVMTITGGFLFGALWGTVYTVIAATVGATCLYFLVKTAIGSSLRHQAGPWMEKLAKGFQENAFNYMLVLRLIPIFPFFVVNLVPALLGVKARTYITATAIGIIPGSYVYTAFGTGVGRIFDAGEMFTIRDVLSTEMIIALIGLAVLSLLPVLYKRTKKS
jgi:uncharacterized membrane protein YdjX (TVP38/TMEM64 family)